jgi:hypothetical protein
MNAERFRGALAPGWRWLLAIAAIPLLLGAILTLGVAISWLTGSGYEPPDELEAGGAAAYTVGRPKLFEEEDVWVVPLPEGEFLALYDRGTESACPLQWSPRHRFQNATGWFVDACTGSAYDLTGRCFSEGCLGRPLSRFPVTVTDDIVVVDLTELGSEPAVDPSAPPVNPSPND